MIVITKGSYGHKTGNVIKAVYAGEIVELTKEQEARLVKIGVAEYVDTKPTEPDKSDKGAGELPDYNENMKLDELKAIAEQYGVDASAIKTKKEVVALINASLEDLPDLGADDSVVDDE